MNWKRLRNLNKHLNNRGMVELNLIRAIDLRLSELNQILSTMGPYKHPTDIEGLIPFVMRRTPTDYVTDTGTTKRPNLAQVRPMTVDEAEEFTPKEGGEFEILPLHDALLIERDNLSNAKIAIATQRMQYEALLAEVELFLK